MILSTAAGGEDSVVTDKAVIVRLPNWIGNAVQSMAMLERLQRAGYRPHLIGKAWAGELFAAYDWPTYERPAQSTAAIMQLWQLRRRLKAQDRSFGRRINMMLLTDSYRSAMEAAFAGLRSVGYARNWRSHFLRCRLRPDREEHATQSYWRIGNALLGAAASGHPEQIQLSLKREQIDAARSLLEQNHIAGRYAVLCPFSGSGQRRDRKRWPGFRDLARHLHSRAIPIVLCPGPGEDAEAYQDYPGARTLRSVPLGTYAALMRDAWCTIANDTGPGHIAAAVGASLVTVAGPHFSARWAPLGPRAAVARTESRWPLLEEVTARLPP